MTCEISGLMFDGPFEFYSDLRNLAGVYAIVADGLTGQRVVDVGESDNVRVRINAHEREDCWKKACRDSYRVATLYMPRSATRQRRNIETLIRKEYGTIPFGDFQMSGG